jgi:hypothetical protein
MREGERGEQKEVLQLGKEHRTNGEVCQSFTGQITFAIFSVSKITSTLNA